MRKIPTNREQVLATWEVTKAAAKRLSDAQTNYAIKHAEEPDMQAAQKAIEAFRVEYASEYARQHAEIKCRQQLEMDAFRAERAEIKRLRESEFLDAQRCAKAISDAKEELKRAEKALDAAKKAQDRAESRLVV